LQLLKLTGTNSVSNPNREISVKVYPNPASEFFTVLLPEGAVALNLQLLSLTGQILIEQKWPAEGTSKLDIQIGHLPAGIYFAKIRFETGAITSSKLIKK
jgi:hypothetical protein